MSKITACPACDGTSLRREERMEKLPVPYGPDAETKQYVYVCETCGFDIDDSDVNDVTTEKALEISRKESIIRMLNELESLGNSLAGMERALDLPQRTISRWKASNEVSSGGLALLRIIRTYPWIIDVADHRYEPMFAAQMLVHQAANVFGKYALSANMLVSAGIKYDATSSLSGFFFNADRPENRPGTVVQTEVVNEIA